MIRIAHSWERPENLKVMICRSSATMPDGRVFEVATSSGRRDDSVERVNARALERAADNYLRRGILPTGEVEDRA